MTFSLHEVNLHIWMGCISFGYQTSAFLLWH